MGYSSESRHNLKSREISLAQNTHVCCQIVLEICIEHGSGTAVLYALFINDLTTEQHVMGKRDFPRFEFKMRFRRTSCIATAMTGL